MKIWIHNLDSMTWLSIFLGACIGVSLGLVIYHYIEVLLGVK